MDQRHRFIDIERLGQVFERAALVGEHGAVEVRMCCHDDDRQCVAVAPESPHQFETVDAGHPDIGHQDVGAAALDHIQHAIGVSEAASRHAFALESLLEHPANGRVIVDDPDN